MIPDSPEDDLLDALRELLNGIVHTFDALLTQLRRRPGRMSGLPPDKDSERTEALPETPVTRPAVRPTPCCSETPVPSVAEGRYHKENLLAALRIIPRPLDGRALARRAEIPYSAYIRKLLGEMVRDKEVMHAPQGGYWLPSRPLPDT